MTREEAIAWCDRFNNAWANANQDDDFPDLKYSDTLDQLFYLAGQALRQQEHFRDLTKKVEPLTNAQKIRSMTDEELAELLFQVGYDNGWGMKEYALEWLQQPAGEEGKHETD